MDFDSAGMQPIGALIPDVMLADQLLNRYPEIEPVLDAMELQSCNGMSAVPDAPARLAGGAAAFTFRGGDKCGCDDATGWIQALGDPRFGRAIVPLHRNLNQN
ncbi:hypothetical protein [Burkholderia singularis]|nr:hypothetical protein [Burkholderia singularis]